jgi:hypothetical protein
MCPWYVMLSDMRVSFRGVDAAGLGAPLRRQNKKT